jgi:hypothetical protein
MGTHKSVERLNHRAGKTLPTGVKITNKNAQVLDESILGVFSETFSDIFNILRVGVRDIAITAWSAHKEVWNKYKFNKLRSLEQKFADFVAKNKLYELMPEEVEKFKKEYERIQGDRIKTINEDRRKLQTAKNEINSSYMQVMRPIYRDLLQGQNGALLFMANPAVYMAVLGARTLTDPNVLGKFANSDLALQSDLNVSQLGLLQKQQAQITTALAKGFGAEFIVGQSKYESKKPKTSETGQALNEQRVSDEELQTLLTELGFQTPAELLATSPAFKELEKIGRELVQSKIKGLSTAKEDQQEEIDFLKMVLAAKSMEDLRRLSPEVEKDAQELEKKLQDEIDKQVQEFLKTPDAVSEFVKKKNLTDSSPENVETAFREEVEVKFAKNLEAELEATLQKQKQESRKTLAVIERGILSAFVAGEELETGMNFGAMPLPKDPDWKTLDATPAGRAWKKAITDYIKDCVTLEM